MGRERGERMREGGEKLAEKREGEGGEKRGGGEKREGGEERGSDEKRVEKREASHLTELVDATYGGWVS